MDCIFIKARNISRRNRGRRGSAVDYARYLARLSLPKVDYKDKGELLDSGIVGSYGINKGDFWKLAEAREKQTKRAADARYAKEYILGLPYNLSIDDKKALCYNIANMLAENGRVIDWYFHAPDKSGGSDKNWHCHFMMSERGFNGKQFEQKKNIDWKKKEYLANNKRTIGRVINEVMQKRGLNPLDLRTAEEKGQEEVVADVHEGRAYARRKIAEKITKKYDKEITAIKMDINDIDIKLKIEELRNGTRQNIVKPGKWTKQNIITDGNDTKTFDSINEQGQRKSSGNKRPNTSLDEQLSKLLEDIRGYKNQTKEQSNKPSGSNHSRKSTKRYSGFER